MIRRHEQCIYHKSWMEDYWRCNACDVLVAINVTHAEHEDDRIHRAIIRDDTFYKCEIGRILSIRQVKPDRAPKQRRKKMHPKGALVGPGVTSSKRTTHVDEDHIHEGEGIRAERLLEGDVKMDDDATDEEDWGLIGAKRLREGWVKTT